MVTLRQYEISVAVIVDFLNPTQIFEVEIFVLNFKSDLDVDIVSVDVTKTRTSSHLSISSLPTTPRTPVSAIDGGVARPETRTLLQATHAPQSLPDQKSNMIGLSRPFFLVLRRTNLPCLDQVTSHPGQVAPPIFFECFRRDRTKLNSIKQSPRRNILFLHNRTIITGRFAGSFFATDSFSERDDLGYSLHTECWFR